MNSNEIIAIVESGLNRHQGAKDRLSNSCNSNPITITLEDIGLWDEFYSKTNEMIVTKGGRRMFPIINVKVSGLDSRGIYSLAVEFVQRDNNRWKFANGGWTQGGKAEPPPKSIHSLYIHPQSPNFGSFWTKDSVKFTHVKLTNQSNPASGQVVLNSLHKYNTRVHVIRMTCEDPHRVFTFDLPQTEFIAVTAYQNEEVTQLKVRHNPFAKAFQENREGSNEPKCRKLESPKSEDCSRWYTKANSPRELHETKPRRIDSENEETYNGGGYGSLAETSGFQSNVTTFQDSYSSVYSYTDNCTNQMGLWTPEYSNNYHMGANTGGPMRSACFVQRSSGPYGSGYGRANYK